MFGGGESGDGKKRREIYAGVGMTLGSPIELWKLDWKRLDMDVASCRSNERSGKQWRRWTGIAQAKRRLWLVNGNGVALDCGIKDAKAGPNTCLAGPAKDLAQNTARS